MVEVEERFDSDDVETRKTLGKSIKTRAEAWCEFHTTGVEEEM